MRTGTEIRLELDQKLTMTPELRQALFLLTLPQQELLAKVEAECLENPFLEREEEHPEASLTAAVRSITERLPEERSGEGGAEEQEMLEPRPQDGVTLAEHLREQLFGLELAAGLACVCDQLVDYLNGDGYLKESDADLAVCLGQPAALVAQARCVLQGLEPAGVAAQTIEDCLLRQVSGQSDVAALAREIIAHSLADVASGRWRELARQYRTTPAAVQAAVDLIRSLNPRPGRGFAGSEPVQYLYPDAFVRKAEGKWVVLLRDRLPTLRINPNYLPLLTDGEGEVKRYLGEYYKRALFFMQSLEKRRQSMLQVAEAIVAAQQPFLEKGRLCLQPLTLQMVAEATGLSISTVSRVVSGKYMSTPHGLLPFKAFFSNAAAQCGTGKDVSTQVVKQQIASLIAEEDVKKPLSDQALVEQLASQGLVVARRTVAKYREQLGLPAASARRRV